MLDENASESTCVLVEWNHIISPFIRKEIMKKNSLPFYLCLTPVSPPSMWFSLSLSLSPLSLFLSFSLPPMSHFLYPSLSFSLRPVSLSLP